MLISLLKLYEKISSGFGPTNIADYNIIDRALLKPICSLFSQFDDVIGDLSDDKMPFLYRATPIRCFLLEKSIIKFDDLPSLQKVKLLLDELFRFLDKNLFPKQIFLFQMNRCEGKRVLQPIDCIDPSLPLHCKRFIGNNVTQQLAVQYVLK
jgi:hypothetical protein